MVSSYTNMLIQSKQLVDHWNMLKQKFYWKDVPPRFLPLSHFSFLKLLISLRGSASSGSLHQFSLRASPNSSLGSVLIPSAIFLQEMLSNLIEDVFDDDDGICWVVGHAGTVLVTVFNSNLVLCYIYVYSPLQGQRSGILFSTKLVKCLSPYVHHIFSHQNVKLSSPSPTEASVTKYISLKLSFNLLGSSKWWILIHLMYSVHSIH